MYIGAAVRLWCSGAGSPFQNSPRREMKCHMQTHRMLAFVAADWPPPPPGCRAGACTNKPYPVPDESWLCSLLPPPHSSLHRAMRHARHRPPGRTLREVSGATVALGGSGLAFPSRDPSTPPPGKSGMGVSARPGQRPLWHSRLAESGRPS